MSRSDKILIAFVDIGDSKRDKHETISLPVPCMLHCHGKTVLVKNISINSAVVEHARNVTILRIPMP